MTDLLIMEITWDCLWLAGTKHILRIEGARWNYKR